jgi:hypothetical protein
VAALDEPMTRMAGLASGMRQVGELQPTTRLGRLQPSLDATAALRQPMERLSLLVVTLDRPVFLILLALGGLTAWGAVTFLAVRFAIVSAGLGK